MARGKDVFYSLCAAVAALSVSSCGGGGGDSGGGNVGPISGVINVDKFTISAAETRTVVGDLTINCSGPVEIAGRLVVNDGFAVTLKGTEMDLSGSIGPAPAAARSKNLTREDEPRDIRLEFKVYKQTGSLESAAGRSIMIFAEDVELSNTSTTISANGRKGTARLVHGESSGSILISGFGTAKSKSPFEA